MRIYLSGTFAGRPCDSYNLNTSPLCNLTASLGTLYWGEDVKQVYAAWTGGLPDYINREHDNTSLAAD